MKLPDSPTDHAALARPQRRPTDDLCSAKEAAEILRSPLPTIYYLAKHNKLPAIRIGGRWRFHRSDLRQMVSSPSVFVQKRPVGSLNESLTKQLATHIAKAICNAQATAEGNTPQHVAVCFVFVTSPSGDCQVKALEPAAPYFTSSAMVAA